MGLQSLKNEIAQQFPLQTEPCLSYELLRERLAEVIQELLDKDFPRLAHICYRIDVSEKTLKNLLANPGNEDLAMELAELVIERQLQKIKSRQYYHPNSHPAPEEKW